MRPPLEVLSRHGVGRLPRLALLLPALHADPSIHLVVPATAEQLRARRGFVPRLLAMLLPDEWFRRGRVLPYAEEAAAAPVVVTAAPSRSQRPTKRLQKMGRQMLNGLEVKCKRG